MNEGSRGLREVVPNQCYIPQLREFTVTTGAAFSTLQDIKLPDSAGGYSYNNDGDSSLLANRTLYWRTQGDTLELIEISLNFDLVGNRVKYKFVDTPLLPGITVHESWGNVVILVPTVGSVHKLSFPHPAKLEGRGVGGGVLSVLADASVHTARECQHILSWPASTPLPSIASTHFTHDEESVFVLGNSVGHMTCVRLGRVRGMTSVNTLAADTSYLGRVWTSLVSRSAAGDQAGQPTGHVISSLPGVGLSLVAVCRDHKIRVWSLSSYECILATDLVQFTAEAGRQMLGGSQGHRVSLVGDESKGSVVCVYLCFQQHSQFLYCRLESSSGQLTVNPLNTVYCPEYDLVSFTATERGLVGVWISGDGDTVVRRSGHAGHVGWENVTTCDNDMLLPEELENMNEEDPRQVYLAALFAPGAFLPSTLLKTVAIFRRSVDGRDEALGWDRLRGEVIIAVENEIQNNLAEYEVTDEDYVLASRTAWAKFYSCACQYRSAGLQPMGLVDIKNSTAVMVIRREMISWLRPVEALEQVVLCGGQGVTTDIFSDIPPLAGNNALANDVLHILTAAGMVGQLLPDSNGNMFQESSSRLISPDLVSRSMAQEVLASQEGPGALSQVTGRLSLVQDLQEAMECLLYCLELDRGSVSSGELDISAVHREGECTVYSSKLGVSIVAGSLRQQVETKLELSQHLLVLQQLTLACSGSTGLNPTTLDMIQSTFLPRTTVMVHCYSVMSWLSVAPLSPAPQSAVQQSLRQLAVLKLNEHNSVTSSSVQTNLVEMFISSSAGDSVRSVVGEVSGDPWLLALPPLANMTAQLLWPRCAAPTFLHFLLSSCQPGLVQQYCRQLSTWCDWHCHARQFLLATALLNSQEQEKAADLFLSAAGGVPGDVFLTDHLLNLTGETSEDLSVSYYLRVISLLEQFSCPDLVIMIAETGLAVAPQHHPERATLAYILFSYHLKLGHNDDAYDAMVSNPDKMRRKDSLRQFLVTLFDRGELAVLSGYPYIDMLDDVESIIESRARSADLSVNNYYDFLYSFHIMKENYRKAAHVMYECGARLGLELNSLQGLKKQAQSYLACINSLRLVNKKYQWIVKPGHGMAGKSPKRSFDGDEKDVSSMASIDVIEIQDIEKELILTQARLKLCGSGDNMSSLPLTPGLTPAETVALLIGSNLFMDAINICQIYNLSSSMVNVAQGLATKCAKLSSSGKGGDIAAAWTWLADNRKAGGREGGVGEDAVEAAWQLLEHIVTKYEERGCTSLHRAVLCKLAQARCSPPPWLISGYKLRDCSELIRVYHQLGYIELAGEVAIQYIKAVMGDGAEYFGLEGGLKPTSKPVWVPWTVLDRLVLELRENVDHAGVKNVLERLTATIEVYLQMVEDVSRQMINVRAG